MFEAGEHDDESPEEVTPEELAADDVAAEPYEFGSAHLLEDRSLFAQLRLAERAERDARARKAELVALIERRASSSIALGLKTALFLAREAGIPGAESRAFVATAAKIAEFLPETLQALAEQRISWRHAEVIARGMNKRNRAGVQAMQETFIQDACGNVTFEAWQAATVDQMKILDQDGAFDPAADEPEPTDSLRIKQRADGSVSLNGRFHGESAAIIAEQLEAAAERVWHQERNDQQRLGAGHRMPKPVELNARGLLNLCEATSGALGTPLVTLAMTADDPTVATTRTGQTLRGAELDALLGADARFRPLIENRHGAPLWLGSSVRLATDDLRLACLHRDGGCAFPGCTAPARWAQIHHTFPFGLGGPTDIDHMVSLCSHHHRAVIHRTGWVMWPEYDHDGEHDQAQPTGWFIIERADGVRMYSQRHGRQPDHPPPDNPPPPWVQQVIGSRR